MWIYYLHWYNENCTCFLFKNPQLLCLPLESYSLLLFLFQDSLELCTCMLLVELGLRKDSPRSLPSLVAILPPPPFTNSHLSYQLHKCTPSFIGFPHFPNHLISLSRMWWNNDVPWSSPLPPSLSSVWVLILLGFRSEWRERTLRKENSVWNQLNKGKKRR